MIDYGKFVESPEIVEIGDSTVKVLFVKNEAGEDIVNVVRANPSAWYIAVTDDGYIVSMENDIEHSQIVGIRIIGINSDFGYTRGPGGTVYGKYWDGSKIVDAPSLNATEKRVQCSALSRVDFRLRLKNGGITTAIINDAIESIADEDLREEYQIIWEDSPQFKRLDPFVVFIFKHTHKTLKQADIIWGIE